MGIQMVRLVRRSSFIAKDVATKAAYRGLVWTLASDSALIRDDKIDILPAGVSGPETYMPNLRNAWNSSATKSTHSMPIINPFLTCHFIHLVAGVASLPSWHLLQACTS
jgi:hypothetical protein